MALGRWKFGSSRKASTSSSSSNSNTDGTTNGTTTPVDNNNNDPAADGTLTKTTSRLSRFASNLCSHKSKKSSSSSYSNSTSSSSATNTFAGREEYPHLHKPFTAQNLEHQRLLGAFEWNFGGTPRRSSVSGISPRGSMDDGLGPERAHPAAA
ncbi:Uu.00g003240.m01.CDS01 [Anthostomella pinea]|uniref:Uu.00g003240.m01.CDS01 n=1 Tax=Anthostomella pinea TaxID=933095 RepID=A0AAI8YGA1_9PEZI|nr:Uu.00g003240.m01.CDS01 [Anthostomella pinea]